MPTGMIVSFAGNSIPAGFLLCDGSAVSRVGFSALFALLGETYGAGDTVTTFNLPDLRGRLPQGKDISKLDFDTLGKAGGETEITMNADQIPVHRHILQGQGEGNDNDPLNTSGPTSSDSEPGQPAGSILPGNSNAGVRENVGSNANVISPNDPHNNMSPFQVVNYMIQT